MRYFWLVLSFFLSVAANAAGLVTEMVTYGQSLGYHAYLEFHSVYPPSDTSLLLSAVYRSSDVEFSAQKNGQNGVRSFCIREPFLNTDHARGYVVHSMDGDDANQHWWFMPKDSEQTGRWCFDARPSYRFDVFLVDASGRLHVAEPMNFEIEQDGDYSTNPRQASGDFAKRGVVCTKPFCVGLPFPPQN